MSEKITFQELIESIAEETGRPKQFTHDFLKSFVGVINDDLKSGSSINIAGFGKFKLRRVDERAGYNPQTGEKITIPAHSKAVFKPYKSLREQVNASYSHLEPTLIEEKSGEAETENKQEANQSAPDVSTEPNGGDDLKPAEADEDIFFESKTDTSEIFSFEENTTSSKEEEQTEDIVEYRNETEENEVDEELAAFMGFEESGKTAEEKPAQEPKFSEASPLGTAAEEEKSIEKATRPALPVNRRRSRKRIPLAPFLAAASVILLLTAGAVWYFSDFSAADISLNGTESAISATNAGLKTGSSQSSEQSQQASVSATQSSAAQQAVQSQKGGSKQLIIAKGETLWSIAKKYYNNPRLWPWIYDTNNSIENPDLIFAGARLSVPITSGTAQYGLSSRDSVAIAKGYIATYKWYKDKNSPEAKNYLWVAGQYHEGLDDIADVQIDKADLSFVNRAR